MSKDALEVPEIDTRTRIDVERVRKEPRLVALLFCEHFVKGEDKKPSVIDIFDRMYMAPNEKRSFFIFLRTAEAFNEMQLQVFSPSGNMRTAAILEPATSNVEYVPEQINYLQAFIHFQLEAKEEGAYWFRILHGDNELGGNGLMVDFSKSENGGGDDSING